MTILKKTILASFLIILMLSSFKSFTQNSIIGNNISIHATFHHVGIQLTYSGDDNKNAMATMEANINGAGFKEVHRLSRVGNNRFVGTVFSLNTETFVEVRVTVTDPDGVTNSVHTASITTRNNTLPISNGNTIHVSKTGNDNTGDGSANNPYGSIQYAVEDAIPGSTISIHAGLYHEEVEVAYKNATQQMPITIKSAGDGEVVLDGSDSLYNQASTWTSEGNNIYSAQLTGGTYYIGADGNRLWRYDELSELQNLIYDTDGGFYNDEAHSKIYLRLPGDDSPADHIITLSNLEFAFDVFNSSHIIFDDLVFKNFNKGEHSKAIGVSDSSINLWIVNSRFEYMETAIRLEAFVQDLVVMNNDFSDQGVTNLNWDHVKDVQWWLERGALYIGNDGYSGFGTIFSNNYVHEMFDGVKIVGGEDDYYNYPVNSDVENNLFSHLSDDGIEMDGFSCNIRAVNNVFKNMLVGVSVAPALYGPSYIIRNIMDSLNNVASDNFETMAVKFNYDEDLSGEIFIYHNTATTFEPLQAAFSITNDVNWENLVIKNNIWQGTSYAFFHWIDNTSSLEFTHDYDLLYAPSDTIVFFDDQEFLTVEEYYNATDLCFNCIKGDPNFVDALGGDLHLTSNSPAINKAIPIKGINDIYIDIAPDMGAFEYQGSTSTNEFTPDKNIDLLLIPNPARNYVKVQVNTKNKIDRIAVYNAVGQVVIQSVAINNTLNISYLSKGVYIVEVSIGKHKIREKLIVQN